MSATELEFVAGIIAVTMAHRDNGVDPAGSYPVALKLAQQVSDCDSLIQRGSRFVSGRAFAPRETLARRDRQSSCTRALR
jgi:hypothetical protein